MSDYQCSKTLFDINSIKKNDKHHLVNFDLDDLINKGIEGVNQLLDIHSNSFLGRFLQDIDNTYLKEYLAENQNKSKTFSIYNRIIHPLLFKVLSPRGCPKSQGNLFLFVFFAKNYYFSGCKKNYKSNGKSSI